MRATLRRLLATLTAAAVSLTMLAGIAHAEPIDIEYPRLHTVTMTSTSVAAGGSITAQLGASDDVSIARVRLRYISTEGWQVIEATRDWRADGKASVQVPADSTNGSFLLDRITLTDGSGKDAYYFADGRLMTGSPSQHTVDLASQTFAVTGGIDRSPPRISSVSMALRPTVDGAPGALAVTVNETGPVRVKAWWTTPSTSGNPRATATITGGTGKVSFTLTPAGTFQLEGLEVEDADGNMRQYLRDGRILVGYSVGSHDLNFVSGDLTLGAIAPMASITAHPNSVRVLVGSTSVEDKGIIGWRVTVTPGGMVRDIPATGGAAQLDVGGLVNGTAYAVSVVAKRATGDSPATTRTVRPMPSTNVFAIADATGDQRVDVVARQPMSSTSDGGSYVYPTNGAGGWGSRSALYQAGEQYCERVAPADTYRVALSEVLCYGPALMAMTRDGSGYDVGTSGWSSMRFVDGGQDLTSDGVPDIVGVNADGVMKIYQMGSTGSIASTITLGSGWNAFTSLFQAGDFNGDRRADLVGVDTAGRMWLYAGNGRGGFASRIQIGSGWGSFGAVFPLRDFNGDGAVDIGAITMDGKLYSYPGNGRGSFFSKVQIGTGWSAFL